MDRLARWLEGRVYNLGPAARIPPGEGKAFEIASRAIAVFRTRDGRLFATQAACPHRQGPLADGMLGGDLLVCPLHGFKFDLTTGRSVGNDRGTLETFAVELSDRGEILLRLGRP
jgi:nitrite reductase (NADH) small subunit